MNDLAYLVRQMKAPRIAEAVTRVAEQARSEAWSYEDLRIPAHVDHRFRRMPITGSGACRAPQSGLQVTLDNFGFFGHPLSWYGRGGEDGPGEIVHAQGP